MHVSYGDLPMCSLTSVVSSLRPTDPRPHSPSEEWSIENDENVKSGTLI